MELLPLFRLSLIDINDLAIKTVSFNTHGCCGESVFTDTTGKNRQNSCIEALMTRYDIGLLQETHSDDLEQSLFDSVWSHSHNTFWSHGLLRNQGGICIALKRFFTKDYPIIFGVDVWPGRCLLVFCISRSRIIVFGSLHIPPHWSNETNENSFFRFAQLSLPVIKSYGSLAVTSILLMNLISNITLRRICPDFHTTPNTSMISGITPSPMALSFSNQSQHTRTRSPALETLTPRTISTLPLLALIVSTQVCRLPL